MTNLPRHLYVHVPFCKTICHYCDFTHLGYSNHSARQWLEALKLEITKKALSIDLDTIYLGGGTPSALSFEELEELLKVLSPYTKNVKEYTIEINPETLTQEKALLMSRYGINRASIGFQSSDPMLLKLMNRHHTLETVKQAMDLLKNAEIDNISLDLMYALPNQTIEQFQKSVMDAILLSPKHLSLYSLTIEPNTVFARLGYQAADEDIDADMYEWVTEELPKHGFIQYEISNFAQPGYESKHNQAYWDFNDYYGLSMGATGKECGIIYENTKNFKEYLNNPLSSSKVHIDISEQMFESLMMGLRLVRGLNKKQFQLRYKKSVHDIWPSQIETYKSRGLLLENEDYLYCSQYALHILNSILTDFIDS